MPDCYQDSVYFVGEAGRLAGDCWTPAGQDVGTVLLLHGSGQTRHSWRNAGPALARRGWTTFTVDLRGHGESDWALDGRYGLDALVADLSEVVHSLREAPVIIGAALGGVAGLVLAGEQQDAVRALVMINAAPRVEPAGARRVAAFLRSAPDGFDSPDEVAVALGAYHRHRPRPVDVDGLLRQGNGDRWYWHWDPAFLQPRGTGWSDRVRTATAGVRVPTLVVRGTLSDVVTEDGVADLLAAVPHARGVEVADTGHLVAGDDNSVFLPRVTEFLDTLACRVGGG